LCQRPGLYTPGIATIDFVLFLRRVFFAILLPGTVTVFLPHLIVSSGHAAIQWNFWRSLAILPLALGAAALLWCIWDFAVSGRGTLAPIDPPKELVVRGLRFLIERAPSLLHSDGGSSSVVQNQTVTTPLPPSDECDTETTRSGPIRVAN
jgi:hypothetical protein